MEDIKEKSSDELFEELGYEKDVMHYNCDNTDVYTYKKDNDFIRFRTADKRMVTLYKTTFSSEELKAINKKVEELRMEIERCEYCKKEAKPLITIERLDDTFDYNKYNTFIWQNELITLCEKEQCLDVDEKCKINYCPMCR